MTQRSVIRDGLVKLTITNEAEAPSLRRIISLISSVCVCSSLSQRVQMMIYMLSCASARRRETLRKLEYRSLLENECPTVSTETCVWVINVLIWNVVKSIYLRVNFKPSENLLYVCLNRGSLGIYVTDHKINKQCFLSLSFQDADISDIFFPYNLHTYNFHWF